MSIGWIIFALWVVVAMGIVLYDIVITFQRTRSSLEFWKELADFTFGPLLVIAFSWPVLALSWIVQKTVDMAFAARDRRRECS